jgi:hypothetical protein
VILVCDILRLFFNIILLSVKCHHAQDIADF